MISLVPEAMSPANLVACMSNPKSMSAEVVVYVGFKALMALCVAHLLAAALGV